jgi:hypothetical protein
VTGVSATPNAQPIAFKQVMRDYFETFVWLFSSQKVLALGVCEFVTPSPNRVWSLEARVGIERLNLRFSPASIGSFVAFNYYFLLQTNDVLCELLAILLAVGGDSVMNSIINAHGHMAQMYKRQCVFTK